MRARLGSLVAALVLAVLVGQAAAQGVYIEQEVVKRRDGEVVEKETIRTWIEGNLLRLESSCQPNHTIIDSEKSVMWVVDDRNKVYMEFPLKPKPAQEGKRGGKVRLKAVPTGRTMKIGRWDCFEVELVTDKKGAAAPPVRTFVWLTKSAGPESQRMRDALSKSLKKWMPESALKEAGLDGLPVRIVTKTEIVSPSKRVLQETVVTISAMGFMDIPPSLFEIPSSYRRLNRK